MSANTITIDTFVEMLGKAYAIDLNDTVFYPSWEEYGDRIDIYDNWNSTISIDIDDNVSIPWYEAGKKCIVFGREDDDAELRGYNIRFLQLMDVEQPQLQEAGQ